MVQTIDVTGLPEAVVADLRRLVETMRAAAGVPPTEPPRPETMEEWNARFRVWAANYETHGPIADDSRESIYEGRGE